MKYYIVKFGSNNPASFSGLSPTFSVFLSVPGATPIVGPTLSELASGTGLYYFAYGPTNPIAFVCDGGSSLSASDRYVTGILDPIQAVDQNVGQSFDGFGSTASDPTTLVGYAKRAQEIMEGDATFDKTTGTWTLYNRGSSTILRTKTLVNNTGNVTKS